MELGKQIRKYRQEQQLSQEELADKIFVTRQTISNWENDKNYPDVKSLIMLSSLFGISLDILVKGDLKEMKEQIKETDIARFNRDGGILTILFLVMLFTPIPLVHFLGSIGFAIWAVIAVVTLVFALKVEKHKKAGL